MVPSGDDSSQIGDVWAGGNESCVLVKPSNGTARGAVLHGENYSGLFL